MNAREQNQVNRMADRVVELLTVEVVNRATGRAAPRYDNYTQAVGLAVSEFVRADPFLTFEHDSARLKGLVEVEAMCRLEDGQGAAVVS